MDKVNNTQKRIWELDFARGIAVAVMIVLHVPYMLDMYGDMEIYDTLSNGTGIAAMLAYAIHYFRMYGGAFFIFLSGICAPFGLKKKDFLLIFIALALTGITYVMYNSGIEGKNILYQFGILHILTFSKYGYEAIKKLPTWLIGVIAFIIIISGYYIMGNVRAPESILLIFGVRPVSYPCFDYQPILPQFGWFLFGAVISRLFYKDKKTVMPRANEENIFIRFFSWIGRHSLVIYLIQLPVIYIFVKIATNQL